MGMSAMMGYGLGAIKEQFKTPNSNNGNSGNSEGTGGGFKGILNRAKSIISPGMNLSDEKDYNGNVNPIRNVLPKQKENTTANSKDNVDTNNKKNSKLKTALSTTGKALNVGAKAGKSYLEVGARMAEGDFSKNPYKNVNKLKKFQATEYTNQVINTNNNEVKKIGDNNEPKK